MIAQCLYQSDPKNLASMGRQRLACQRAARKLQWGVQKERISETNEPVPLLMRPAVKEILQDAEQHRFDVLLIGNRDSLCCDAADMESFLTVLNSFNIHIFAGGQGSWVEPNGRHYAPLPRLPWQEDDVAEVGFLLFGRSDEGASILPAWVQTEHVEPPDERLTVAQKENPDTVAWITIPGTNIDAPVQQYGDNDYYLRRDEKGAEDYHGCLYADYACRMDSSVKFSRNLIFYGHTFTDEDYTSGFEDLHKYRVFEFGQENPYIYVSLADEKLTYQIFSVWVCDANADTDCIQADPDDAAFQQILDKAVAGCAFDYGVDVMTDDHILTLSTCTADPNSRLLVVAKLIDGGGVDVAS